MARLYAETVARSSDRRCPQCWQAVRIRKDGSLAPHMHRLARRSIGDMWCPGSEGPSVWQKDRAGVIASIAHWDKRRAGGS